MQGFLKHLQSGPIVIHYVLYNNFFYIKLASAFVPQKVYYYIHDDTDTFLLSFFIKLLISLFDVLSPFVVYFFRKILMLFACFLSEAFFVLLTIINNSLPFFYIEKKLEKIFYYFFICFEN